MIIDAHSHLGGRERYPEWWWKALVKSQSERFKISIEEAWKKVSESWDWTGERAVKIMDQAGVDAIVMSCLDAGMAVPGKEAAYSIEKLNQLCSEVTRRYPGRFVMAAAVDPRRPNAVKILEDAIKLGARSLKLYPPAGFYPNDRICYPLYEKCVEHHIPVNFHTGPFREPLWSKYSQPIHLDDVAADFPDLIIHATHTGYGLWHEMVAIAQVKRNIVGDLAGWTTWLETSDKLRFYREVRWIMDTLGPGRLMFASDMANGGEAKAYVKWSRHLTDLPEAVRDAGITFTEQEVSDYMGGTAARILGLKTAP